jgi:hypothetical protein
MRQRRWSTCYALLLAVAGALVHSAPGHTQALTKSAEIFNGGSTDVEGIKLGGWGSGKVAEDRAYKTGPDNSLRVETNGYYAGGRIQFEKHRDITDQKNDPYGFLEFVVRFQPGTRRTQASAAPMLSPEGLPPVPGAASLGGEQAAIVPDTTRIKVVLICDEGTFVASNFPVTLNPAREEGWFSVAIPFVAFRGIDKAATAKIKELRVFGDTKDTFWIGEIRTTTDDEPINVDPLEDAEVSVGEAVEFRASATGGISPLQYIWDFDISDGFQEDAVGPAVVHVFRKESKEVPGGAPGDVQPYVITLTVRDLSGAKKPVRKTANVIVNP